jgi:hypothetical protein
MKQISKIGNLVVKDYTKEKLIVHKTQRINASPEAIWKIVSDHTVFSDWMPMVSNVDVDDTYAGINGNGCERVCTFGKDKIKEKVVHIEENEIFAYKAEDTPMFKNHLAVVKISRNVKNSSIVDYYVFFKPIGMKGFMMKNMMLPMVLKKALKNLTKLAA